MLSISFFSSSSGRHGHCLFQALQLLRLSTTTTTRTRRLSTPPKAHNFIVDYLISKFGFSLEKAVQASKPLSHLKSIDNPESFVGFMRSHGFSDAHIKKIVSCHSSYLRLDAEKTLAPKIQSLKHLGFCGSDIVHLVISNPQVLDLNFDRTVLPRIRFWQGLLGSRDYLVRLLKHNICSVLHSRIETAVMPNLAFLRGRGVSDERISMVARQTPRFILQRLKALAAAADRVEKEMGIARSSGMFLRAMLALSKVSKDRFNANLEFMKSFGWSEADFLSAFRKAPHFLNVSRKMLARKMEFLLKEAGCKPSDVAAFPVLLMYSLEKRLVPRHRVMEILMSRGLVTRQLKMTTLMNYSEKVFMDKFVIPHIHKVPELQEMYKQKEPPTDSLLSDMKVGNRLT